MSDVVDDVERILIQAHEVGPMPLRLRVKITNLLRRLPTAEERVQVVTEVAIGRNARYKADLDAAVAAAAEAPRAAPPNRFDHRSQGKRRFDRQLSEVPAGLTVSFLGASATVRGGRLVLADGAAFDTPTPAARAINGDVSINGWEAWKVSDGRSLAECYDTRSWPPLM